MVRTAATGPFKRKPPFLIPPERKPPERKPPFGVFCVNGLSGCHEPFSGTLHPSLQVGLDSERSPLKSWECGANHKDWPLEVLLSQSNGTDLGVGQNQATRKKPQVLLHLIYQCSIFGCLLTHSHAHVLKRNIDEALDSEAGAPPESPHLSADPPPARPSWTLHFAFPLRGKAGKK